MECLQMKNYKVQNMEPSAFYVSEFISRDEEEALLANVYAAPRPKWTQLSNRRLQNWGGVPHARGMLAERVPGWLDAYLQRVQALGALDGRRPNHVLINEYLPGQGIMPHADGELFYPVVATVSAGSHTVLRLAHAGGGGSAALLLEPRSLLLLSERLYTHHLHGIEEIHSDLLDDSIANLDLCSGDYVRGSTVRRDTRVSLTIRHVPKTTSFKLNIGNKS